jgi:hypothetical protein
MEIKTAQQEVRAVYLGGSVGSIVSGVLWLVSAALATWANINAGVVLLVFGGIFIFPLTQLALKLLGRRASLGPGNPFNWLAMQSAFILPLCLPVILALASYQNNWFYPAFMIVLGVHYLPFITLYGMWEYGVLAALLIGGGVGLRYALPISFTPGGWLTGVVLLFFALVAWRAASGDNSSQPETASLQG